MGIKSILKEHNITVYKLCKECGWGIGKNNKISRAIKGERAVAYETVEQMLLALSRLTGKTITINDVKFTTKEVLLEE